MKNRQQMVRWALIVAVGMGMSLLLLPKAEAQTPQNGNFETGAAGSKPASPWSVSNSTDSSGTQTSVLLSASAQSPFTTGSEGVILTDATPDDSPGHGWTPLLAQTLSTSITSGTATLSFDFNALQNGSMVYPWDVYVGPSSSTESVLATIGTAAGASTMTLLNAGGAATTYAFTPGTWYNMTATFNLTTHTYNATITPFGGSATTFTNLSSSLVTSVDYLGFGDASLTTQVNGQLYLDNVSVQSVPEPASAGLLGFGALAYGCLALWWRKSGAAAF